MSKRILAFFLVFLVGIVAGGIIQPFRAVPSLAQSECQTFPETGKTACGRFLQYWQQNGGLAQQGFPITNQFSEVSDLDGKTYTVQYFERAVFEYHPEKQPPYDVLLSQLGTFRLKEKYPNGDPSAGQTPVPIPISTPVESVTRSGEGIQKTDQFHLDGGDYTIDWTGQDKSGYSCFNGGFLRNSDPNLSVFVSISDQQVEANTTAKGTTHAYGLKPSDSYYLDMSSACAWSVTIHK